MRHLRHLTLVFLARIAPLAAGCSAPVPDDPETADVELKEGRQLGELGGVKINGTTVAAPKKIGRILENLGLEAHTNGTLEEVESRGVPSYLILFYGPGGRSAGSAHFLYTDGKSADSARRNARGTLLLDGKSYSITAKDLDAMDAIANEPRAFADLAYGADKIVFSKPMEPWSTVETTNGDAVATVARAFQADEVPDPNASFMRCPPSTVVSFHKGAQELTSVGLACEDGATGIILGSLTTPVASGSYGGVHVDAGVVLEVQRSLASDSRP